MQPAENPTVPPEFSPEEQYSLMWPGKKQARAEAFTSPAGSLTPVSGALLDAQKPGNTIIEGDNLDALKHLLADFSGRIRFIYIDPPYNTGKQFTYRDHFRHIAPEPQKHTPWLSMMYPRLILAREMLRDDGVMYVSIDDSEVHNLIHILDEIFGEQNRAGVMTWVKKKKGSHLSKTMRCVTEYVLVYAKNLARLDLWGEDAYAYKWQPLVKRINHEKILTFEAGIVETTLKKPFYQAGTYGTGGTAVELLDDIHITNSIISNRFSIRARTVWTQQYLDRELALGTKVSIRSEGMGPNVFRHDQSTKKKRPTTLLNELTGIGTNEDAWSELRAIFNAENIYSYPKPVSLIKYLVKTISKEDPSGIFMDFFAGSGTTGQAVWEANREDGGNRTFILIQSPEKMEPPAYVTPAPACSKNKSPANVDETGKNSQNSALAIVTISELCIERLRRVANNAGEIFSTYEVK